MKVGKDGNAMKRHDLYRQYPQHCGMLCQLLQQVCGLLDRTVGFLFSQNT
jgi:hypothetical protein